MNNDSLHQVWKKMREHDAGIITAYRYARDHDDRDQYSKNDNLKRTLSLKAKLRQHDYFIAKVEGSYVDDHALTQAKEVAVDLFLVVDANDSGGLEQVLCELGEAFEQNSVLIIPAGGVTGKLIGTNHDPDGCPDYGSVKTLENPVFGESGEIINHESHPFVLSEDAYIIPPLNTVNGRWGNSIAARKKWEDLTV